MISFTRSLQLFRAAQETRRDFDQSRLGLVKFKNLYIVSSPFWSTKIQDLCQSRFLLKFFFCNLVSVSVLNIEKERSGDQVSNREIKVGRGNPTSEVYKLLQLFTLTENILEG